MYCKVLNFIYIFAIRNNKHSNTFTAVKRTLSAKIGQTVFTIESDAYRILSDYLDDIAARCDKASRKEVLDDVELRVADLLVGWLGNPANVVDTYLVRRAQETIGRPEEFGELREPTRGGTSARDEGPKRLARSATDKVIGGVCGGLAEFMRIDPTLVRIVTLLFIVFGGLSGWLYLILWAFIPCEAKEVK